jgi:hypothetical protein
MSYAYQGWEMSLRPWRAYFASFAVKELFKRKGRKGKSRKGRKVSSLSHFYINFEGRNDIVAAPVDH